MHVPSSVVHSSSSSSSLSSSSLFGLLLSTSRSFSRIFTRKNSYTGFLLFVHPSCSTQTFSCRVKIGSEREKERKKDKNPTCSSFRDNDLKLESFYRIHRVNCAPADRRKAAAKWNMWKFSGPPNALNTQVLLCVCVAKICEILCSHFFWSAYSVSFYTHTRKQASVAAAAAAAAPATNHTNTCAEHRSTSEWLRSHTPVVHTNTITRFRFRTCNGGPDYFFAVFAAAAADSWPFLSFVPWAHFTKARTLLSHALFCIAFLRRIRLWCSCLMFHFQFSTKQQAIDNILTAVFQFVPISHR